MLGIEISQGSTQTCWEEASQARGGRIDRRRLLLRSIPIQQRIFALAQRNLDSRRPEVGNLAAALFEHNERLFSFLEYEGVEPTNNSAERALRTGVQ